MAERYNLYEDILYFLISKEKIKPKELLLSFNIDINEANAIFLSMIKNGLATATLGDDSEIIYHIKTKNLEKFLFEKGKLPIEINDNKIISQEGKVEPINNYIYLFVFILIAGPLFYLFLTYFSGDEKKGIDYCNSEERAYLASNSIIKRTLKSPTTAKFPHYSEVDIAIAGKCSFQIDSYVDSQNGFEAMIRSYYVTVVTYDEKTESYIQKSLKFK
ncbi:hypothetical protein [Proteus terrae]|uniref:hypothetical protein n=1 Tax=Proteus terrae TaxID=1574161 RepID=UPI0034E45DF7